ncbi:MAG: hypothetical protein Q7T44_10975 [Parvibaculum sp.]|nr:hypothetical protein [Parvibaculum sp.]
MKKPVITEPATGPDWDSIRPRYEDLSVNLVALADEYGVAWQTLAIYAARHGWAMRKTLRTPVQKAADLVSSQLMPSRLASRLKRLIAREIEAIEGETLEDRPAVERERDARRLASLVRSLETLNEIKARKDKQEGNGNGERATSEDLSAELERRFALFHATGETGGVSGQSEPGGKTVAH